MNWSRSVSSLHAGCGCFCALLLSGCLISEPPPLEAPERVAPRALVDEATPTVFQPVQTTSTGPRTEFSVRFWSEDLGETVVGKLYLNFGQTGERLIGSQPVAAGSLDDKEPRTMNVPFDNRSEVDAGCYSITLAITHRDNFDDERIPRPIDYGMTDFVTWWAVHDLAPQDVNLDECFAKTAPPAPPTQ